MFIGKHRRRRLRSVLLLDALVLAVAVGGTAALAYGWLGAAGPPPVRVSGRLLESGAASRRAVEPPYLSRAPGERWRRVAPTTPGRRPPSRLSIPAIGVRTSLVRLELNPDGTLEVPEDPSVAGWYAFGPSPGQPGAAVIAGHVDSAYRPAVFYRLGELAPGGLVQVTRSDRTEVRFRVYAVREFAKAAFPTSLVYGQTPRPELRLITCGGPFDSHTGHYVDNVVVFARLVGNRGTGAVTGSARRAPG